MKKNIRILMTALVLTTSMPLIAYGEDLNDPTVNLNNPNTSYPESASGRNATPNEPDHTFGSDSSVHKLPADIPTKTKSVIYEQSASPSEEAPPATASDHAILGIPKSSNEDVIVPTPPPGTAEKP